MNVLKKCLLVRSVSYALVDSDAMGNYGCSRKLSKL